MDKSGLGIGFVFNFIYSETSSASWQRKRVRELRGAITKTLSILCHDVSKPKFRSFRVMLDIDIQYQFHSNGGATLAPIETT
jgi:hypothetical protein